MWMQQDCGLWNCPGGWVFRRGKGQESLRLIGDYWNKKPHNTQILFFQVTNRESGVSEQSNVTFDMLPFYSSLLAHSLDFTSPNKSHIISVCGKFKIYYKDVFCLKPFRVPNLTPKEKINPGLVLR